MTTNTSSGDTRTAVDKPAPQPGASKPHSSLQPIERLFRDALRNQQVHPLMELVRRYREKDAP